MTQFNSIPMAPLMKLNSQGEQVITLGVTGTRKGLSDLQKQIFEYLLQGRAGEFHHGDCVGADAELDEIIKKFPLKWKTICHPPEKDALRAFRVAQEIRPPKPYLIRNMDIVNECNILLAFPKDKSGTGGTWYTINYFRSVLESEYGKGRPPRACTIIMPNGDTGHIVSERKSSLQKNNFIQ